MIETLKACENSSDKFDLYIVGGFDDLKNYSNKLTTELFSRLNEKSKSIN
jgi:hypothetical protein